MKKLLKQNVFGDSDSKMTKEESDQALEKVGQVFAQDIGKPTRTSLLPKWDSKV